MTDKPLIPPLETRVRSVAKLKELVARMDKHIADLDYLNACLEEEFSNSPYGQYCQKRERILAQQRQSVE